MLSRTKTERNEIKPPKSWGLYAKVRPNISINHPTSLCYLRLELALQGSVLADSDAHGRVGAGCQVSLSLRAAAVPVAVVVAVVVIAVVAVAVVVAVVVIAVVAVAVAVAVVVIAVVAVAVVVAVVAMFVAPTVGFSAVSGAAPALLVAA